MPGESPGIFGDALRRLAAAATYLYQDGVRYWYSTQPTVTKLAEDRAEQLKRDPDKVVLEIEKRVKQDLRRKGNFQRIHDLPAGSQDVNDDLEARLVVLRTDHPYSREPGNAAEVEAKAILESRGNAPRLYRNTLVFLAADKTRLQDLDEAARRYLAWESILSEKELLNLDPQQVKQAETQKTAADTTVDARLPETFQWLLVPTQPTPQAKIEWSTHRLTGPEALAERASKKLRSLNELVTIYAASWLRHDLDRIPLWRGDHVTIQQLIEDYGRYVYLQRLRDPKVLLGAIRDGVASLIWEKDGFAFADSHDEAAGRYRGLRVAQNVTVAEGEAAGLIVKPEVARRQIEAERAAAEARAGVSGAGGEGEPAGVVGGGAGSEGAAPMLPAPEPAVRPKRFHGSVVLDSTRVGRDAGRIAEEVIAHLAALVGAKVTVTLEVEAEIPDGAPEQVVRTVTENGRTLRFSSLGFERE